MSSEKFHERSGPDAEMEERYQRWQKENPGGYILNTAGSRSMLHRVGCLHLEPFQAIEARLVRNPKICAATVREITKAAQEEGLTGFQRCSACLGADARSLY